MIYVSVDIETTALVPIQGQIIQFGAIIEDTEKKLPYEELPKFEFLLENPFYTSDRPYALSMHPLLFAQLASVEKLDKEKKREKGVISVDDLAEEFYVFLKLNGIDPTRDPINVAGKNAASFDIPWCEQRIPNWNKWIRTSQRVLDPSILFLSFKDDKRLPNMKECKIRAGFTEVEIAHTTLADAMDVINLLRTKY